MRVAQIAGKEVPMARRNRHRIEVEQSGETEGEKVEGLNQVETEIVTQEFELLSADLDTPVETAVQVPYPPSSLTESEREVYDLALLQVAHARARGSLDRD
jgi:hypothetical protein